MAKQTGDAGNGPPGNINDDRVDFEPAVTAGESPTTSGSSDTGAGNARGFGESVRPPDIAIGGERVIRRRRRASGSDGPATSGEGRKTRAGKVALDAKVLGPQLVGAHQIAAMALDAPSIIISDNEGRVLAEPIVAICDYYGLKEVGAWMLWVNLVTAVAMVYGPRLMPRAAPRAEERQTSLWPEGLA